MNKRKDIFSIFKRSGGKRHRLFDGSSTSALVQWAFILCFGLILTAVAIFWSVERFNYWGNLEVRVTEEDVSGTFYDQKAVRTILEEYENRAERSETILNNLMVTQTEEVISGEGEGVEEVSTTTATTTESD